MDLMQRRGAILSTAQNVERWDYRNKNISIGTYDTGYSPFTGEDTGFTFLLEFTTNLSEPSAYAASLNVDLISTNKKNGYSGLAGIYIFNGNGGPYFITKWMNIGGSAYHKGVKCYLPGTNRYVWWHAAGTRFAKGTMNGIHTVTSSNRDYMQSDETITLRSTSSQKIVDFIVFKRELSQDEINAYISYGTLPKRKV